MKSKFDLERFVRYLKGRAYAEKVVIQELERDITIEPIENRDERRNLRLRQLEVHISRTVIVEILGDIEHGMFAERQVFRTKFEWLKAFKEALHGYRSYPESMFVKFRLRDDCLEEVRLCKFDELESFISCVEERRDDA